jgi:hypothetical protein
MAREIRLDQIGGYVEQQMEKLLRVAVLETDSRIQACSAQLTLVSFRA